MELIIFNKNAGFPLPGDFPKGAIFLLDKPLGWTSFDVVNKIRWHLSKRLGIKKLKVGHAGTLDPLASGLLILCVGDYTKKIEQFQAMPKEYTGTFTLGATTPSFDLEKAIDQTFPTEHITSEALETARQKFVGEIEQIPPVFSAVKVDGKRLYKNARTGEVVEIEARKVKIEVFEIGKPRKTAQNSGEAIQLNAKGAPIWQHPDHAQGLQIDFRVVCSKGTYIRSLAHDFGAALHSGAYLSSLRRTKTGGFSVSDAWQVEELVAWITA